MTDIRDLHVGWMQDPSYRAEYDALEGEFALAAALIRTRADAGLTQEQLPVHPDADAVGEGDGDNFAD